MTIFATFFHLHQLLRLWTPNYFLSRTILEICSVFLHSISTDNIYLHKSVEMHGLRWHETAYKTNNHCNWCVTRIFVSLNSCIKKVPRNLFPIHGRGRTQSRRAVSRKQERRHDPPRGISAETLPDRFRPEAEFPSHVISSAWHRGRWWETRSHRCQVLSHGSESRRFKGGVRTDHI
jgi:hypothetical protein